MRGLTYLEEDEDAPTFLAAARVSRKGIPVRKINDFEEYIRRHGLLEWAQRKEEAS